jgi:hypothetical protein
MHSRRLLPCRSAVEVWRTYYGCRAAWASANVTALYAPGLSGMTPPHTPLHASLAFVRRSRRHARQLSRRDGAGPGDTRWPVGGYSVCKPVRRKNVPKFLTIRADHSYLTDVRTYAVGGANGPGELVAYSRAEGGFVVRNDSRFTRANFIRTWDRDFNGGKESVSQVDYILPRPGQPDDSGAHFEVTEESLTLHYLSYPADAAVETAASYERVR